MLGIYCSNAAASGPNAAKSIRLEIRMAVLVQTSEGLVLEAFI